VSAAGLLSVYVSDSATDKGTRVLHIDDSNNNVWTAASANIDIKYTGKPFWVSVKHVSVSVEPNTG